MAIGDGKAFELMRRAAEEWDRSVSALLVHDSAAAMAALVRMRLELGELREVVEALDRTAADQLEEISRGLPLGDVAGDRQRGELRGAQPEHPPG